MNPGHGKRTKKTAPRLREEQLRERATERFINALELEMFRRHGVISVYYDGCNGGGLSAQRQAFVDCQLRHPELDLTLDMVRFVQVGRGRKSRVV